MLHFDFVVRGLWAKFSLIEQLTTYLSDTRLSMSILLYFVDRQYWVRSVQQWISISLDGYSCQNIDSILFELVQSMSPFPILNHSSIQWMQFHWVFCIFSVTSALSKCATFSDDDELTKLVAAHAASICLWIHPGIVYLCSFFPNKPLHTFIIHRNR